MSFKQVSRRLKSRNGPVLLTANVCTFITEVMLRLRDLQFNKELAKNHPNGINNYDISYSNLTNQSFRLLWISPLSAINSIVSPIPDVTLKTNFELGEERKQVFMWMSEIDCHSHHEDLCKNLLPGSGQWLLESTDYVQWGQSSRSAILWLHGMRTYQH
jgi:hypothetical protein